MTGGPRANRDDRTSLVIGVGMAALIVIGVASVFGDGIGAAFAPAGASSMGARAADSTVTPPASSVGVAVDAGGTKS
ncbi:MAG TPA: hypothetical protein VH374_21900 [Polyangia bacterium]|jgi:hypothetical protein|nr:hypothetical protein [Polyangia bacterium]